MKVPSQPTGKTTRLFVAGGFLLVLALLVFVQAAFNLSPFLSPSLPSQIVLLYTLSTFIFLVLLIFGFVLLRTLVKIWIERKQQKPGSKFKTSVVGTLIGLTLVPAIFLFLFGVGLVNRSIVKWFSVPVDAIFQASEEINVQWALEHEAEVSGVLRQLAAQPPEDLDRARANLRMRALLIVDPEGRIVESSADADVVVSELARLALADLGGGTEVYVTSQSDWIGVRQTDGDENLLLIGAFPIPEPILDLTSRISAERSNYGILVQDQKYYRDIYVYILVLMTVLVLFAAVWVGLFLSKRVTVPIEALAEATREISAGNLDHRVDIRADDELGMLVKLFNDMAGRLQETTQELETRRRYIEVILENIPTGVISVDTRLRVQTLNRAARTMFSVETAERLDDIFKAGDIDPILDLLARAADGSVTREMTFRTPGRPAQSAVTASPLQTGGFVLVVEDLTEVVRAQKANAWREVARRLAHEIKNPLTPIQLSAERIARNVAKMPAAPRTAKVIDECVGAIVDEVSSLKNLVDEFVRFARLPAVSRMPGSIRELVEKTLSLYEGRLEGVTVRAALPEDLPPILMDAMQIKRVLVNLIDNALESMSGEPVKKLNVACELARDGTMARLTIEDTGCGITPQDRERLFTPYFSTRKNGTGLGLAIASRIVADHGGYIGAVPNVPVGTRFVIELPVCPESSLSTTSPASGTL